MIVFDTFRNAKSIVTGAYFCALDGASTNTYDKWYHDSATLVAIPHFSLANCVKNAGHTPFTSTYFALLTNLSIKECMITLSIQQTFFYTWNLYVQCGRILLTGCQKRCFVGELCHQLKNGDVNTWGVCNKALRITYSNNSAQLVLVIELWVKIWVAVYLWPLYYVLLLIP